MPLNGVIALILRYFTEFVKVYVYHVVVKKFTFAISSPDEFLVTRATLASAGVKRRAGVSLSLIHI